MKLTRRQQEVLDFIGDHMRRHGMPPTRAEIVEHFGFASPNAAQCHLRALAARGAISLRNGAARGIVPVHPDDNFSPGQTTVTSLPVIGRVAAGTPLLAVENHEDELPVDINRFSPKPDYLLRVSGDSMTGAGILADDLLLVHSTRDARSGQIVIARIDEDVTVKRLIRTPQGGWMLQAENPRYDPIEVDNTVAFTIEGLAVGVLRSRIA